MKLATEELNYRSVRVAAHGKLRGSRARQLGEALESLHADGYDQVVVDLGDCGSLDSVGALALRTALDLGQRLFVVLDPIRGNDVLPPEIGDDPRLRVFPEVEAAVRQACSREESGVLIP